MRNKGVKIIMTTSLVLAVMFVAKQYGKSDSFNTNVSTEVAVSDEVSTCAGVTAVLNGYMKSAQVEIGESVEKSTEEPTIDESTEDSVTESTPDSLVMSKDWDAEDSYMLCKIAMAEAEGEDTEGKALVMLVVLNRVWTDEFPDTIEGVIYQKNQFSPISNGRYDKVEPDDDCWEALRMVESGWDESQGALYFESEKNADNWHSRHLKYLFTHGGHRFYR